MNEIKMLDTSIKEGLGNIRIAMLNDEPIFNLYDICFGLGYTKEAKGNKYLSKDRIENICKGLDIKGLYVVYNGEFNRCEIAKDIDFENTWITESSFYDLCLESHAKNAKKFKRWVTSEVLPSIRNL